MSESIRELCKHKGGPELVSKLIELETLIEERCREIARLKAELAANHEAIEKMRLREMNLTRSIAPKTWKEQLHLHEGSPERDYWHHGYYIALRDSLKLLDAAVESEEGR